MKQVLHPDPIFDAFVSEVQAHLMSGGTEPLFTTDVDPDEIYALYINNLPATLQQYHTCNCCRRFIQRFGTLARIDAEGRVRSAMWPAKLSGRRYAKSVEWMGGCVEAAAVTGVFAVGVDDHLLGQDVEGGHRHLHVPTVNMRREREPGPWMALKRQDRDTLSRALVEYPVAIVAQAVALLEGDDVFRAEKVRGPARFLLDIHKAGASDNLVWRHLAHAPAGFCTPRTEMIGTLLDDLVKGLPLADVKRKFASKMDVESYRRPTAPPKAGTIANAERLVADLGIEPDLVRRFATVDDLELLWRRRPERHRAPVKAGVFAGLTNTATRRGITRLSWTEFARDVLPGAVSLEFGITPSMPLAALTTGSGRLFQWDNPVAYYTYREPSPGHRFGFPPQGWARVEAVTLAPWMWSGNQLANFDAMAVLAVEGAYDRNQGGLGLFPEFLRSTFHSIRSVIEAFSTKGSIQGRTPRAVGGLIVNRNGCPNILRVDGHDLYHIKSW